MACGCFRREGDHVNDAKLPPTVSSVLDILNDLGFRVVEQREDGTHNRLFILARDECRVRLLSDRGEWSLAVAFGAGEWIHPDVWEAYLDKFPLAGDLSDLAHQIRFLRQRFDEISAASSPDVEDELAAIGEEYMRRRLGLGPGPGR